MVIGVDIASDTYWARAFNWRDLELGEVISFKNTQRNFNNSRVRHQNWPRLSGKTMLSSAQNPQSTIGFPWQCICKTMVQN